MRARSLTADRHLPLALRLLTVMALYTVGRLAFFFANRGFFADMTGAQLARAMLGGLVFDVSAVAYTNLIVIVLVLLPARARARRGMEAWARRLFIGINAVALALNAVDVGYFPFTLRRTTSAVFKEFGHESRMGTIVGRILLDYWAWGLLWAAMVVFLFLVWRDRPQGDALAERLHGRAFYAVSTFVFLFVVFWATVAGRGGLYTRHHRPITNSNAGAYVDKPQHIPVVLNTPFSIMRTLRQPALPRPAWYPDEASLARVFDPVHPARPASSQKPVNVVVIILESFGGEHIGYLNPEHGGFTPFLDALADKSRAFTNAYANGRKTIDAMPSVTASIPSLVEPFILSHYSGNKVNSLASLAKRRGYETLFFHGAPNGSMGFQAFVKMAGYEHYFGMREYGNDADYDGTWGIWDEEFFQFFARKLGETREPFLATLFSLSSHHPYKVPARYQGRFPKGPAEVDEAIGYSDHALSLMFDTLSRMPFYERTLFVITADHGSALRRPEYQGMTGRFRIPLLLYRPDGSLAGRDALPAQQLDVMPTVARILGTDEPFVAFGNDLLDPQSRRYAINYSDGVFQLFQDEWVLHFDGKSTLGLWRYREDPLLTTDLSAKEPEIRVRLEGLVKAVIQQFDVRMLDDRLTAAGEASPPPAAASARGP